MDAELKKLLDNFITKEQTTFKIWQSTHQAIKICASITGESMCAFVNRIVIRELKKLVTGETHV